MARVHRRQSAQKRKKKKRKWKMGSSAAYKTIGPFLSQRMGRGDASGQAGGRCNAVDMYAPAVGYGCVCTTGTARHKAAVQSKSQT